MQLRNNMILGGAPHPPTIQAAYDAAAANLDVSIWSGCPPEDVFLLNITGRVAKAEIGNSALALGLTGGVPAHLGGHYNWPCWKEYKWQALHRTCVCSCGGANLPRIAKSWHVWRPSSEWKWYTLENSAFCFHSSIVYQYCIMV